MSPILKPHTLEIISRWPDQTRRVGAHLGSLLRKGDLVCLVGDLGSGKTTLVQGMARGWGTDDPVSSPTFVLVNVYRQVHKGEFIHMDAYRLSGPAEAAELDIDHYLDRGCLVVEWADRIDAALTEERLLVEMQYISEQQRDLMVSAVGERYQEIVELLRERVYGV
jgi:tRNA threonylcarbamoyladenosine biosynthesis protein TsaE